MSQDELTEDEKAEVLAHIDHKAGYDKRLYHDLSNISVPRLDNINGPARRAIIRYIEHFWREFLKEPEFDDDVIILSALTEILLKGYELGRRQEKSINR